MLHLFRRPAAKQCEPEPVAGQSRHSGLPDSRGPDLAEQPHREQPRRVTPPDATGFAAYSLLLDPKKQIIGYRMRWNPRADHKGDGQAERLNALVSALAAGFVDRRKGWTMGKVALLLEVTPQSLAAVDWGGLPAKNIVLCWSAQDLAREETLPLLQALRAQGFGHLFCGAIPDNKDVCALATHVDVGGGEPEAVAQWRSLAKRAAVPVATRMRDWTVFDACACRRIPVLVDAATPPPLVVNAAKRLEPEAMLIISLLQKIQRNEDVREIEASLKHDAALTYRLLRHISSPALAGVEIASLRHAVSMLGYARLFRWLSMLLTTANLKSRPAFVTKQAIIRGRFVELLGQSCRGTSEADDLFLVGMFSVIGKLLGVPMEEIMERVQLAEAVQMAILRREGAYGPFLTLAIACETGSAQAEQLADEMLISPAQVNAAHLNAIAWAQELSRGEY